MARSQSGHEFAVETFANHTDMTEREAEAFVYRELRGVRRGETADMMEITESTVDSLIQSAKKKARLPDVDAVRRVSPKNTGLHEGRAWEIWFANESMIRYVWDTEREVIRQQTVCGNDTDSILDDFDVGGTEDRLEEYTLESLEEYTTTYRDDWEAARKDWGPVFETITAW